MSIHDSSPRAAARRARPDDLSGRFLLAVFAHPDDESLACGGLLAWCAELGAHVSILCITHGEHGPGNPGRALPPGSRGLRETRAQELRTAARVLGVTSVALLDYEDGMLPWADAVALEADIQDVIRRVGPDVVVTFDEDGLYWHPDHIAVHERTTAAVAALHDADDAPALYYVALPAGGMRAVVSHAAATVARRGAGRQPPHRILGIGDADAFGALAPVPTLVVAAGDFATRKLAAIKCHLTQLDDSALALVEECHAAQLLGIEHYRRAEVGSRGDAFIERFASRLAPGEGPTS